MNILIRYRHLFKSLVLREIQLRYRGSWLGLLWAILNPVLMMLVYFFVFQFIFQVRLPQLYEGRDVPFAGFIFSGLIIYFFFSELFTRAPTLIIDNTNYVKKVVFPIEIIPLVNVVATAFNFCMSFLVLMLFLLFFGEGVPHTVIYVPVVVLPYALFLAGIAWFLSAISVYIRDVTYLAGFVATAMLFLSPIFYSAQTVPGEFGSMMIYNPLSYYIEAFRGCVLGGVAPGLRSLLVMYVLGIASFCLGLGFFRRVKNGFADIL